MSFEVLTMGRIGVDVYPQQVGVSLADVTTFGKYLGGSPTNVAVAAARLGRRSAVITGVGDDPFGTYVRRALRGFGVDDRFVGVDPRRSTPVTFCEIFPPDDFPIYFYRADAPDLALHEDELDRTAIASAALFWATGTGLCREPSRAATLAALASRRPGTRTVLDLDHRPGFWAERSETTKVYRRALAHASVAVGNLDECEVAVGETDPVRAAYALLELGPELAVVKRGPDGVLAAWRTGDGVRTHEDPPIPVEVVNGLGAGDAFGGALCHGLLAGWEPARLLAFANAAGAIVAGRLACADAMPAYEEIDEVLRTRQVV